MQASRVEGAAPPLLLLRQQESGREAQCHARDGRVEALARRARGLYRKPRDVGQGDGRLFRTAQDVARRTEYGQAVRLVVGKARQEWGWRGDSPAPFSWQWRGAIFRVTWLPLPA